MHPDEHLEGKRETKVTNKLHWWAIIFTWYDKTFVELRGQIESFRLGFTFLVITDNETADRLKKQLNFKCLPSGSVRCLILITKPNFAVPPSRSFATVVFSTCYSRTK